MTTVLLPPDIQARLVEGLHKAGDREIGGILMGEQVEPGLFRVVDITAQARAGSVSRFVRAVAEALRGLGEFFRRSHHDYRRFNYLGEWHSHPLFEPIPSTQDHSTMIDLVTDPEVGANFAVLVILKLNGRAELTGTATVYLSDGTASAGSLMMTNQDV